ncbi:MAG: hypothetical protein JOZ25_05975 [Actinobacteria bacterium]|nr:hypothetical protein [Actinomycetota bacterium]
MAVDQIIAYRRRTERLVVRGATTRIPTEYGELTVHGYEDVITHATHVALVWGDVSGDEPVLVRVHSECLTGDVFGSERCDCRGQLHKAMTILAAEGRGVLVYLRGFESHEFGRHEVTETIREEGGDDRVWREHGLGAQILQDLGVRRMRLMSNTSASFAALGGFGLEIVERVPLITPVVDDDRTDDISGLLGGA